MTYKMDLYGRKGITPEYLVTLTIVILIVAITLYIAMPAITSFQPGAERAETRLADFRGEVEPNCGVPDVTEKQNVGFSFAPPIDTVEAVDGNRYRAVLQGGEEVTIDAQNCVSVNICREGDSGRNCEAGGSLSSGYNRFDLWYEGESVVIDPDPVCTGSADSDGCGVLSEPQCGEVDTCSYDDSCGGEGGETLCGAINTFDIPEGEKGNLCRDAGCAWGE